MWTDTVSRNVGKLLAERVFGASPKWVVTIASILVAIATGALAIVAQGPFGQLAAGVVCAVGWQVSAALDCADGYLARVRMQATPAGAVLDALADVIATAVVTCTIAVLAACTFPFGDSEKLGDALPLLLLILVGGTLWSSAPLATVGQQMVSNSPKDPSVHGRTSSALAGQTRGLLSMLFTVVRWFVDWAFVLLVASIAIAMSTEWIWWLIAAWIFLAGAMLAVSRLVAFAKLDGWS